MNSRTLLAGLAIALLGCTVLVMTPRAQAADQKKEPEKAREAAKPLSKPPARKASQPATQPATQPANRQMSGAPQSNSSSKRDNFIDRDGNGVDDRRQRKVVRPETANKPQHTQRPSTVKPRRKDPRKEPEPQAKPPR